MFNIYCQTIIRISVTISNVQISAVAQQVTPVTKRKTVFYFNAKKSKYNFTELKPVQLETQIKTFH